VTFHQMQECHLVRRMLETVVQLHQKERKSNTLKEY